MTTISHKFKARGHFWFDAGVLGLCSIAEDLLKRGETGAPERLLWPDVQVRLERDGVVIEAPEERMKPFVEACYEELAARWWNRSTEKQRQNPEIVCYDCEQEELYLAPRRMPTPIPNLSVGGSSWRADAETLDELSPSLRKKVEAYLKEQEKSLWGSKKLLCYGLPVCHPKLEVFPEEDKKKGGRKKGGEKDVCSVCGQAAKCDKVNQTSFPLFASQSATFTFNSNLGNPDTICWECQLLGKFAVQSAFYKKVDDSTFILQFESGDMAGLKEAHREFGVGSDLALAWRDNGVYFSNFQSPTGSVLSHAKLTYEILWGFYLAAYELVMENQKTRREEAKKLLDEDDDELDGNSLQRVAALNVVLMSLGEKGNTFITREVVSYTDTAYLFRLIDCIKKYVRKAKSEAIKGDVISFFNLLFRDLQMPNPQKTYDPLNGLERNRILQQICEKKPIVHYVERFVFEKSLKEEYPWLGRILFFVIRYGYALAEYHRDLPEGDGKEMGMTKEQIDLAANLGAQIVISAKENLGEGEGRDSLKGIRGDLFTLRKTRTATDFLEQLNRLQFRYGLVLNKEIVAGVLEKAEVPFEDFKAYCMIAALNVYNSAMHPHAKKDENEAN